MMKMLSEVTNNRTDYKADLAFKEKQDFDNRITAWLQSRPEVGVLNSGKFYIIVNDEPKYIEAFSK